MGSGGDNDRLGLHGLAVIEPDLVQAARRQQGRGPGRLLDADAELLRLQPRARG